MCIRDSFQGAGFQNATGGAGSQDVIGGQGDTGPQDTAGGQGSTGSQDTTGGQGGTDSVLRFVFAGDVLLSDHVLAAYERGGGIRGVVDEELQAVIDTSDIFMVNEEFPFSDRGSAAADKMCIRDRSWTTSVSTCRSLKRLFPMTTVA